MALWKVKVENPTNSDVTQVYYLVADDADAAIGKARRQASIDWVQDEPVANILSLSEVKGKLVVA